MRDGPTANKAILIASVDLHFEDAEAADEPAVALSLESSWGVEYMLGGIVDNVHLVVLILKKLILGCSLHLNSLRELLLF